MNIEIILTLIGCGIFSNMMSALFGIGGGVLMVPILMTILPQLSIQQVAATSLSIVIGTAIINLSYFLRQKIKISFKSLGLWSIGMIVGVQAGFELSFLLPKLVIIGVFVTAMTFLSFKTFMLFFKPDKQSKATTTKRSDDSIAKIQAHGSESATKEQAQNAESATAKVQAPSTQKVTPLHPQQVTAASASLPQVKKQPQSNKDHWVGSIFCSLGGAIAGLTGIGGGSILAPIISQLKSVEHQQVAVYTNYMMIIGGLGSMYSYLTKSTPNLFEGTWQVGYINFSLIGIVLASSFCTSFFSMRLRHILKARTANLILACLLAFIAVYTLCLGALS